MVEMTSVEGDERRCDDDVGNCIRWEKDVSQQMYSTNTHIKRQMRVEKSKQNQNQNQNKSVVFLLS